MKKRLVIGAAGQLGTELTSALVATYGAESIIASDFRADAADSFDYCVFEVLNVMDAPALEALVRKHQVKEIYLLAAMLSASAEQQVIPAWNLNMQGLLNVLELARTGLIDRVFWPSSIAVFGPDAPKVLTPQNAATNPSTVYGISKVAGEHWIRYYQQRYGVDVRSLRYPGLIGYKSLPHGGTTDYAVEIFHSAFKGQPYTCFLKPDATLPMLFLEDAVQGTIQLMQAEQGQLSLSGSYNMAGMSFSPAQIFQALKLHFPDLEIEYRPDERQKIAESWPKSIDDSLAHKDWAWQAKHDLAAMTARIVEALPQYFSFPIPH